MFLKTKKTTLNCIKVIQSTSLYSFISKSCSLISKAFICTIFDWPNLLSLFAFFNLFYHFYFWSSVAMALIQFVLIISLIIHFKNQLIGTRQFLSKTDIIKIKIGNAKFEEAKTICKKYPSFFEILENCFVDTDGYICLQRDPIAFKEVLQYVKNSSIKLPTNVKSLKNLFHEANFFGIEELAQKCNIKDCLLASEVLRIKVGDQEFEGKIADIRKHQRFYDILDSCKIDDDGYFILQRDPKNFKIILEYIETGFFDQNANVKSMKNIASEAEFYGLTELVKLCDIRNYLLNSELINVKIGFRRCAIARARLETAVCQKYSNFYDLLKTCQIDDQQRFLVQRDGSHFDKIWKYMKSSIITFTNDDDDDVKATKNIMFEAEFYGITELVKECKKHLLKVEANAAVYSRSIFSAEEKDIVIKTGAAVVFLGLGFLGTIDTKLTDKVINKDKVLQKIAQGLIDFMQIRNDPKYGHYTLITDFTLPKTAVENKVTLDMYFNGKPITEISIFDNNSPHAINDGVKESIKEGCLCIAYEMLGQPDKERKQAARQLAIAN